MKIQRHDTKVLLIAVSILLLVAASAAGWFFTQKYISGQPATAIRQDNITDILSKADDLPAAPPLTGDSVVIKISIPSDEGLKTVEQTIQNSQLHVQLAENILNSYLKAMKGFEAVKVLGVYKDRDNILYIDFSDDFKKSFSGDARQEYYLLKSLYETMISNVPSTEDVRALIDGKEIESIGGHFYSIYGLKRLFNE
jgi:hypothetical protein